VRNDSRSVWPRPVPQGANPDCVDSEREDGFEKVFRYFVEDEQCEQRSGESARSKSAEEKTGYGCRIGADE